MVGRESSWSRCAEEIRTSGAHTDGFIIQTRYTGGGQEQEQLLERLINSHKSLW